VSAAHRPKPAAGSWAVERLDLAAYLRRIRFDGDAEPTLATLVGVHRAHLAAIPFENLDIVLGRAIPLDLDALQAKLVDRGRGGYCHEHNLLFAAALERLGFRVQRLLAQVGEEGGRRPPTHLVLRVLADDGPWLADVGFGSGLLGPLAFGAAEAVSQGGWTYRLAVHDSGGWELRERRGDRWSRLYVFSDRPAAPAEVARANRYTSTAPRSPFVGQAVAVRKDERTIWRLRGRTLDETAPDRPVGERELDDDAVKQVLAETFGLRLERAELTALLDTLPRPRDAPKGG
jgi:N-hydroxyarylamine O-acetyltransferase